MTTKYILNTGDVSNDQIEFFQKTNSIGSDKSISLINCDLDLIDAICENSVILVPVKFEKDIVWL